jgi:hypothetical protein
LTRKSVARVAYVAAAAAACAVGWLLVSGRLLAVMGGLAGEDIPAEAMPAMVAGGAFLVALVGVFGFLAWRPQWWGMLLCAWAGLSWVGFGLISRLFAAEAGHPIPADVANIPLISGGTLLAVGLLHLLLVASGFGRKSGQAA